jgi:hypothetical protein
MSRHSFRWAGLAFGLFFLAGVGSWAVWKQDLMTPRQLSLTASGVLILLGVLGVAATIWQTRTAARTTTIPVSAIPAEPTPEGPDDEEAHPQP